MTGRSIACQRKWPLIKIMRFAETSSSVKNINLSLIKARNEPEKSSRLGKSVMNWVGFGLSFGRVGVEFLVECGSSSGWQKWNLIKWMTNLKIFLYSKATNLWQFYALSILLHHSGIVIFDDYPFPLFFRPFFLFQRPDENLFSFEVFFKRPHCTENDKSFVGQLSH